jgi:hypothetical protein
VPPQKKIFIKRKKKINDDMLQQLLEKILKGHKFAIQLEKLIDIFTI